MCAQFLPLSTGRESFIISIGNRAGSDLREGAAEMRKIKRFFVLLTGFILLSLAAWGGSVWWRVHYAPTLPADSAFPESEPIAEIVNILIIGLDQLGNEPARADSIMVLSVNQESGKAALISIPRDARVEIPGHGLDKINHALAYRGGIALMKRTVSSALGVPIQRYVYTNFKGFTEAVDLLGGVTMNVEKRMVHRAVNLPSIDLHPGLQRLSGEQALGYVRYRGDAHGDNGRMRRQQEFLQVLAKEVLQPRTFLRLPQLLEQVAKHVRTDMYVSELLSFSRLAVKVNLDEVVTVSLSGRNINARGVSYVELDQAQLEETVRRYLRWEQQEAAREETAAPKQ